MGQQWATPYATSAVIGSFEIQAGNIAQKAERWSVAITMLLSALDHIDPVSDPRLALLAAHNLATTAVDRGQLDLAEYAIDRLDGHYEFVACPKLSLQRRWLVAEIARRRGHLSEAELLLDAVRGGFIEHGMTLEAADVDLEMAKLAADTGRPSAAEHLGTRAVRALSAIGAPHAAQAALALFGGKLSA